MPDATENSLELEKINAQRITNLEQDTKEIRKDLANLMRELPHIVQDAVSQAIGHVSGNKNSNGKNGNAGTVGGVIAFATIVVSLFGMLQLQMIGQQDLLNRQYDAFSSHVNAQTINVQSSRLWQENHNKEVVALNTSQDVHIKLLIKNQDKIKEKLNLL